MRVINLTETSSVYTSNVYLVLDESAVHKNAVLIDVGCDLRVLSSLDDACAAQHITISDILLTHSHYDHISLLPLVKSAYHAQVRAFTRVAGVDALLCNGEIIDCGNLSFEIIHIPWHSNDSVCLYNAKHRVLFVGDTPLVSHNGHFPSDPANLQTLEHICGLEVDRIYFGHGPPVSSYGHVVMRGIRRALADYYNRQGRIAAPMH